MKRYVTLCLACAITLLSQAVNTSSSTFKKGDWFECEMEFEGDLPVFRNHWIPENKYPDHSALISVRFSYEGIRADTIIWSYEVLRLKTIRSAYNLENSYFKNCSVYDSWYPDFDDEEAPKIRSEMKGKMFIYKSEVLVESFSKTAIHVTGDPLFKGKDFRSYSTSNFGGCTSWSVDYFVKEVGQYIFLSNKSHHTTYSSWVTLSTCKVDYLSNGLAYIFEDKNNQKVRCITKASFELPNKASILVIDKRAKDSLEIDTKSMLSIYPNNVDFVTDYKFVDYPVFFDTHVNLTYQLNGGVGMTMNYSKRQYADFYISPGDSLSIILTDSGAVITGSENNIWWQKHQDSLTEQSIREAPIDNEFKAYLRFKLTIDARTIQLDSINNIDSLQMLMLPMAYLKSYHYSWSYSQLKWRRFMIKFLNKYGKTTPLDLRTPRNINSKIVNEQEKYTNFLLYSSIRTIIRANTFGYNAVLENEKVYQKYFRQYGNEVSRDKIDFENRKRLKVGNKWPYPKLVGADKMTVNILPDWRRYTLLCFYGWYDSSKELKAMSKKLYENVEMIGINQINDFYDINLDTLPYFKSHICEDWGWRMQYPILNAINRSTIFVLIDHQGEILFNRFYNLRYGSIEENNGVSEDINNAIQKYESQKRERFIRGVIIVAITLAVGLLLSFLVYRIRVQVLNRRNARQQLIQDLKLKSVQSQLNPHFLFNALNSIQVLVSTNKNSEANIYLVRFSELLRGVLKNSDKRLVPLNEELEIITRYCELEKLRTAFTFDIHIQTKTPSDLISIPYMLLQPIAENAVKHGILKEEEGGEIELSIREKFPYLTIKIKNTGPGFKTLNLDDLIKQGKGLALTQEKLLSVYGNDAKLEVSNWENGGEVTITLKMEEA